MTLEEFNQWFKHFAAAFPAVQDFVRKSDPTGKETLKLWYGVLAKRDLADALAMTNELFEGERPIPWLDRGFHDWSSVPRHISRLCAEMHPVEPEWRQHTVRSKAKIGIIEGDPSVADALREAMRILDQGGTMEDVRAMTSEVFGQRGRVAAAHGTEQTRRDDGGCSGDDE